MSPSKKLPRMGSLSYYVPTVEKRKDGSMLRTRDRARIGEEEYKFLSQAAWKIPAACRAFAVDLDGSNKKFACGLADEAKKIKEKYHGQYGIRIYFRPEVVELADDEAWDELQDAINRTIDDMKSSLKGSMEKLQARFDEMEATDADGLIVDRINEAKGKLKDFTFVLASLALTADYADAREGVEQLIEAELVTARTEAGKIAARKLGLLK